MAWQANHFNSHPREGGDRGWGQLEVRKIISIPTPAKGVTGIIAISINGTTISIPTPAKGVTRISGCRNR